MHNIPLYIKLAYDYTYIHSECANLHLMKTEKMQNQKIRQLYKIKGNIVLAIYGMVTCYNDHCMPS